MDNQLLYKIALTKIPKVGAVTAKNLVSYCGGLEAVFSNTKKQLLKIPGVGEQIATNIRKKSYFSEAEREVAFLEQHDIRCLFYLDEDYPERLKPYSDSPAILYYKGNQNLNHVRSVAIVGTRKPSLQGQIICESLVEELADFNIMTISGLAYGIDGVAHKTSLKAGIPTIGVLGHGLQHLYPAQHKNLAQQMITQGGLLTEFSRNVKPDRENFPMRNRIVAALCDALIVVQTARRGGSMITAEFANRYHKDVFAVPGRLNDETSKGCNLLIKSHKAALIESAKDIAYIMRWDKPEQQKNTQQKLFSELEHNEQLLVELMKKQEISNIDNLCYSAGLNTSTIASLLLSLEFKGIVKPLPGKRFILVD